MAIFLLKGQLRFCVLAALWHLEMIELPVQRENATTGARGQLDPQLFQRCADAIFSELRIDLQLLHAPRIALSVVFIAGRVGRLDLSGSPPNCSSIPRLRVVWTLPRDVPRQTALEVGAHPSACSIMIASLRSRP